MFRYVHGFFSLFVFFSFLPLVFSQLPETQKNAMIKISKLLENNMSYHWNTIEPNPCLWKGVTCINNNSIISLSLSGFGISTSDFLNVFCEIESLQSLDVSENLLTSIPDGFIRDCGKVNGLKMLNFSRNGIIGFLPDFNGFAGLQFLDLAFNKLNGSIDSQLHGLVGLTSLNLNFNLFNGPVPKFLGKSMVLEELHLSNNNFTGEIPEELMNYRNLTLLDLSVNRISGPITDRIGELSKLKTLLLSSNKLSGGIPENLSNIETLLQFRAYENQFTGRIPPGFFSRNLRILDLSYNKLSGSIPSDLLSPVDLQWVDLSYNSLKGQIPSNISKSLFRLRMGSNSLSGNIPPATIGKLFNLTYLELDNNYLNGEIPSSLGNCTSLALLNLAHNNFTGLLPKELGNLHQLQVLKLQSNHLNGEIPDQIFQLQNLTVLNISHNSLIGSIPSAISRLVKLVNLNLCDNEFNGSIPDSIGNLKVLLELQLGNNKLSGDVPSMPQSLKIALNLSANQFHGEIPENLSGLNGLEALDLSNNSFTGQVPTFLTRLSSLTLLILSNNQLSGTLPQFTQPSIIIDYSGNKDLIKTSTPPKALPTMRKKRNTVTVPVIIGVAAAVLAISVMGIILLMVSRRFYKVNDETQDDEEQFSPPQVTNYHLITANSTHRCSIDFNRAIEVVGNPENITIKSKFSTYYKAIMPCGTSYYVKKLNWSDKIFQLGSHGRFGEELEVLGRINNSNVMTPLAYFLTTESAYLFYEYAQKGTLFDILHGSLENVLDWASRYSIAIGIAQGLSLLHGCSTGPVLLLDLSTKSILMKSLKEPLIGDIELCKVIDPSKSTGSLSTVAGSVGYIPPEYAYTMRVTMSGNVYSFGVVLLELLTGKRAVSEGTELAKWVSSNSIQQGTWGQILDSSVCKTSGVRTQMLLVLKVALACVSVSPEARPKMKNVLRMLLNAK